MDRRMNGQKLEELQRTPKKDPDRYEMCKRRPYF